VTDDRHSVKTGLPSHSHVIIPLKAKGSLVGVLCLYTVPGTDNAMDETKMNLLYTLGNQIGVALDHARLYEEARTLSLRDPLTGLANRRLMDINIERCLLLAERNKTSLNVIMLDIDYFKRYNDTYGHAEGDKLLSEIGRILLNCIRTADLAVRYGGEEFLVLLPETSAGMAVEIAERIRMSVEKETIVTISLGVSSCSDGVATKENIIVAADNALYKAKANGRNRVEIG
jgi:diguanylate cyclase (GGDEF)-like protein